MNLIVPDAIQPHNAEVMDTKGTDDHKDIEERRVADMVSVQPAVKEVVFNSLPAEVRVKILGYAVGYQLIEINLVSVKDSETDQNMDRIELKHQVCRYKLSEDEIQTLYDTSVVFKNAIDRHMRPHLEPGAQGHNYGFCNQLVATSKLDLRLLQVSREFQHEARKALYSTNIFSFSSFNPLNKWLAAVPKRNLKLVRHFRLEMTLRGLLSNRRSETPECSRVISKRLVKKLPNLRSLNLCVRIYGYAPCWRLSQNEEILQMFAPLRKLKELKNLTLYFIEDLDDPLFSVHEDGCGLPICDDNVHQQGPRKTYWMRRETRRLWAQEIRDFVMKKDS